MRLRILSLLLLVSVPLLACASGFGQGGTGTAQCPDSQRTCLTAPACEWDTARACELCRCSPAAAPTDFTPQGPPRME